MAEINVKVNVSGKVKGGETKSLLSSIKTPEMTKGITKGILPNLSANFDSLIPKGLLSSITGIIGIILMILSTSKMLQKVLKLIMKSIGSIIGIFVDMFSIALLPIVYMLRPVAMLFRALMAPYKRKAMEAVHAGNVYMVAGMKEEAMKSYTLAIQFITAPILQGFLKVAELIVAGVNTIFWTVIAYTLGALFGKTQEILDLRDKINSGISDTFTNVWTGYLANLEEKKQALTTGANWVSNHLYLDAKTLKTKWMEFKPFTKITSVYPDLKRKINNTTTELLEDAKRLDDWTVEGNSSYGFSEAGPILNPPPAPWDSFNIRTEGECKAE